TIWRTLTRLFRPDLVENGQLSSLSGQHRFYAIKGRFRTVVKELSGGRGDSHSLACLIPRIWAVRSLPDAERKADIAIIRPFINAVNDVAEMIEEGLVDVGTFLGKYHLALIREVFIAEPYIYYRNLYTSEGLTTGTG